MLYQYRKDYEKITMGLFSLVSELQNMDLVTQEMAWYANSDNHMIYLWKDHSNNWSGLVGIELQEKQLLIHQLVVTPQSHNQANFNQLFDELQSLYPSYEIITGFDIKSIWMKWEQSRKHV
ncbi:reductase [Lentilactobacillus diolivorans]|uniref:reductase n=1 Tax=Lentilactobacillus diolivorans TaxID=179838 RepID=UPI002469A3B9|nr:reductase [Lentilactobacillus diolivorans]MDH5106047.1 reductase [Lentilactobacillus diolivorans]